MSHLRVRDERGKALPLVVDETKRRLFDDLATLILEGVGWHRLSQVMYERFGHADMDGTVYPDDRFYAVVYSTGFWGHTAIGQKSAAHKAGKWMIEPGHPIPDGVMITYNTHEPMYTGDLAERIKAELDRRTELAGRQRPANSHMFTNLLVCGGCGYYLMHYTKADCPQATKLYCVSRWNVTRTHPSCDQTIRISQRAVQEWLDSALRRYLDDKDPGELLPPSTNRGQLQARQATLETEVSSLESQILTMIFEQGKASADVQDLYRKAIQEATERLTIIKSILADTTRQAIQEQRSTATQERAWNEIVAMGLDTFWQQEPRAINQTLKRLLGDNRLVVLEGKIVGTANYSGYRRKPIKKRNRVDTAL